MVNNLPKGCDQQGRHPEAAEAATDLGIVEPEEPEDDPMREIVEDTLLAAAILMAICIIVMTALGVWG
jgi:hypothetical protein